MGDRILKPDELKKLNLKPAKNDFVYGTAGNLDAYYVHSWITRDLPYYNPIPSTLGKEFATEINGKWYFTSIRNDIEERIRGSLKNAEKRAKRQGVPFDLPTCKKHKTDTYDYLISLIPKDRKCPVFKIPFDFSRGERKSQCDNSMTIDRIKSNLGYVRGNLRWVSDKANRGKGNLTLEELYIIVKDYENLENLNKGENNV
mgnify:CR=1 FL=1|jgi:hypothetical protein|tara:strand:- start:655 stop:1257 length:603 start_codon:yes stop_codon:yes gene_type:complete